MIDNNNFKNMPVSRFRVIGIKMEPCSGDTQECDVKRMQKALYGCNKWFYFYKGFDISKDDLKNALLSTTSIQVV